MTFCANYNIKIKSDILKRKRYFDRAKYKFDTSNPINKVWLDTHRFTTRHKKLITNEVSYNNSILKQNKFNSLKLEKQFNKKTQNTNTKLNWIQNNVQHLNNLSSLSKVLYSKQKNIKCNKENIINKSYTNTSKINTTKSLDLNFTNIRKCNNTDLNTSTNNTNSTSTKTCNQKSIRKTQDINKEYDTYIFNNKVESTDVTRINKSMHTNHSASADNGTIEPRSQESISNADASTSTDNETKNTNFNNVDVSINSTLEATNNLLGIFLQNCEGLNLEQNTLTNPFNIPKHMLIDGDTDSEENQKSLPHHSFYQDYSVFAMIAYELSGNHYANDQIIDQIKTIAQLSNRKYSQIKLLARSHDDIKTSEGDYKSFVIYNSLNKEFIITTCGTYSVTDILDDLKLIWNKPLSKENALQNFALKIVQIIKDTLKLSESKSYDLSDVKITFTGHSLGGTLSSMLEKRVNNLLNQKGYKNAEFLLVTWDSPNYAKNNIFNSSINARDFEQSINDTKNISETLSDSTTTTFHFRNGNNFINTLYEPEVGDVINISQAPKTTIVDQTQLNSINNNYIHQEDTNIKAKVYQKLHDILSYGDKAVLAILKKIASKSTVISEKLNKIISELPSSKVSELTKTLLAHINNHKINNFVDITTNKSFFKTRKYLQANEALELDFLESVGSYAEFLESEQKNSSWFKSIWNKSKSIVQKGVSRFKKLFDSSEESNNNKDLEKINESANIKNTMQSLTIKTSNTSNYEKYYNNIIVEENEKYDSYHNNCKNDTLDVEISGDMNLLFKSAV